ncbi:MAG: hypothetical protein LBD41_05205 [Clostridiales Family XIII bacterium]|jgi:hypothetical protein|nr:hypothetical protein [Clostridiales Family XIII bacterium]
MKSVVQISKVIIFIFLFLLTWFYVDSVLKPKFSDGISNLIKFYRFPKQNIDVVFIGSSHVFLDINPAIIWQEKGIPTYVLGGSVQPFWNSYYYIKECLKYQSPKVIVLDVYAICYDMEYSDWSRIVKNNVGLKIGKDKIESIMVSAPKSKWADLILGLPSYHRRYNELTKRDFDGPYKISEDGDVYINGYYAATGRCPQSCPDVTSVTSIKEDLPYKQHKYLNKIINLAKLKNIDLLLVVTPYILSPQEQKIFNLVDRLAKENNIKFINYNLQYNELSLDFSTDFLDLSHLNIYGSTKVSKHIANFLATEYRLEDKRQNPKYAQWNKWAKAVEKEVRGKLTR